MRQAIGNLVKLALLCAGAWLAYSWIAEDGGDNEVEAFARSACLDEARGRYDLASARVYEVTENSRGFVVRISATLARGKPVKVSCLTSAHGGVIHIEVDER